MRTPSIIRSLAGNVICLFLLILEVFFGRLLLSLEARRALDCARSAQVRP